MCGIYSPGQLLGSAHRYSGVMATGVSCGFIAIPSPWACPVKDSLLPLTPSRDGFRSLLRASLSLCPDAAQGGPLLSSYRGQGH